MKAFTVHDVFKIAQFTDAPCITMKQQQQEVETEISGFTLNYLNLLCMHTPSHVTTTASMPWPLLSECALYVTSITHLLIFDVLLTVHPSIFIAVIN